MKRLRFSQHTSSQQQLFFRGKITALVFGLALIGIITRLFYWQVVRGDALEASAERQYWRTVKTKGSRGTIESADGALLVGNTQVFRVYAEPHHFKQTSSEIAQKLAPILTENEEHTIPLELRRQQLTDKLATESKWIQIHSGVSEKIKQQLDELDIPGIGFESYETRYYPEASLAAQVVGFVGKDADGREVGYFGIEGALDKELRARTTSQISEPGALKALAKNTESVDGRSVTLTIRRDIQHSAEMYLREGMAQSGAKSGEVIIMEPSTGKILALASFPTYDPADYQAFDPELYKSPPLTQLYEPGSTFKVLTIAAGLEAGVIGPDTPCSRCAGPRNIDTYTIKTWNNEYHPNISMRDALAQSDNIAMIFVAEAVGRERFEAHLKRFKIGEKIGLELQEDTSTASFPSHWGPVELATTSFGQGVSTTSLQLVRAVGAIANNGEMVRPAIIERVTDPITKEEHGFKVISEGRVVSPETAQTVTEMMEYVTEVGEPQWTITPSTHRVAGKTGTAQIPVRGSYDENKTIASFVGFAPADNPRFVMLVKLVEPTSSPWASRTAVPVWYNIAHRLYLLLDIPNP